MRRVWLGTKIKRWYDWGTEEIYLTPYHKFDLYERLLDEPICSVS